MHCMNLLYLTCLSIVGFVSAAQPACEIYAEWIGTACTNTGDVCGPANSQCFKGKCLCAFGSYYSVGRRACVLSCTDLKADSYLTYPGGGVDKNNAYKRTGTDDECKQICSQDAQCLSTEVYTDKTCFFHYVATSTSNWEEAAGWTLYQKNCA